MEDPETELTFAEPDALGADFITVELDTQPIEYVVKWAEVGSKFTISCVKKDAEEGSCFTPGQVKGEADDTFFAQYEAVYPECEDVVTSVEVPQPDRSDSETEDLTEAAISQLGCMDEDGAVLAWDKGVTRTQPYYCHICGKGYSHSSSLSRHVQSHTRNRQGGPPKEEYGKPGENKKTLQCNVCGVRCNGKRLLAIHKKSHKSKRLHTCNACGKHFNHSSSLSRHRLIHKGKAAPSAKVPAHVAAKKNKAAGGEKQYQCSQCDRVFRNSTSLSKHQVAHVRKLLNSYTQNKDALAKSSDLKIRLKLCSRGKPNYYTLCKKNKRSKAARARLAAQDTARPYACLHCDKRFGNTASLARHEHTHAGQKQYTCNVCKKTFIRLSNLKQHQQTHSSGKLYSCSHCGKTFVHSSSFSRHKKVHMGDRLSPKPEQGNLAIDEGAPLESDSD
ncbi:zinc finger protein 501 [Denticeps clupeoides]|uniref:zinc finger protein 501 n=1 Tax=Denticeps clupeoides TaxID=299321 RepID=UPI0010A2CE0D|nr:zinc finger protein 501-like [Denticeps clupeoides]